MDRGWIGLLCGKIAPATILQRKVVNKVTARVLIYDDTPECITRYQLAEVIDSVNNSLDNTEYSGYDLFEELTLTHMTD